ncbi:MAG TPA: DUF3800 domain-containing protein [Actinophytocola sp.]|uniref:DUF3800 domain-containing protein n=1 Tax=Actinophytocola sp. TaxID=1872138 RepID=UPI002DDD903B|nr:DUF3800 domain-containing protein [Actinophytocola sp.]HEV2783088.1 DUF3800 domain-containing protein [Actinophytocola sp.]
MREVACDESGSEGEKLIGGETDVFAHASVLLDAEAATAWVREVRRRIGSPASEYKANHLLRRKHRAVLEWLLEPSGPIDGSAHVHLIDKAFLVVERIVELLDGDREMAVTLYRDGPLVFGRERWAAFLDSFNTVLRVKNRRGVPTTVDSFFGAVDELRAAPSPVRQIMERLRRARPRVEAFRALLLDDPATTPPMDPMIPALARAIDYWSADGTPVSLVHDEQPGLSPERIMRLPAAGRLAGLRFVDSRDDPRVQIADYLAGIARKIASDELDNRGDAELVALLRPYVDPLSTWGDDRSRALLAGPLRRAGAGRARPR